MPAFAAIAPLTAERTLDVFIETPGRQVVAARGLVSSYTQINHRPYPVVSASTQTNRSS
nr:MAG TPA: hypothetical protein [Caudoviricetes sp.]